MPGLFSLCSCLFLSLSVSLSRLCLSVCLFLSLSVSLCLSFSLSYKTISHFSKYAPYNSFLPACNNFRNWVFLHQYSRSDPRTRAAYKWVWQLLNSDVPCSSDPRTWPHGQHRGECDGYWTQMLPVGSHMCTVGLHIAPWQIGNLRKEKDYLRNKNL